MLLRGLFAGGIILHTLNTKRWRVNYGQDRQRKPKVNVAVPFRSKDTPSLQSEFSNSDVVIILTCFSHYRGGLTDEALIQVLKHLSYSEQAQSEYEYWTPSVPKLPHAFRSWHSINIDDRARCAQLFPYLHVRDDSRRSPTRRQQTV
ncbi:hypothetical protein BDV96DRAFT_564876 [Lophiotrema nucula]|uniref:ubiquitinyl hydrolase 1 n=1 Tax=Lophiotrema nucula TaxID=690887 RepID=A0A6A5ZM38_9PLEO|nr:hypothetical protein BDV96DRAFT_564876 [Lophiotrema nucula]